MAVDLSELVDALRREVSPPGTDLYPNATDQTWIGSLTDAFWEIRLYGFLSGFEENAAARGGDASFGDAIVTPVGVDVGYDSPTGFVTSDLSRELQQLVVLWAGWKIVLNQMQNLSSTFRAKAGPVEFETQKSASVLKDVLDQLKAKIDFIIINLSAYGGSPVIMFDAVIERTYAQATGETWWVR